MYTHIDDHLTDCGQRGFSRDTTIPARRMWLERLIRAHGDLHKMQARQIATFLANPDWGAQTRATAWGHLHGYFRWAVRQELIARNPMDLLDRPKVPYQELRGMSPVAFRYILDNAVEPYLTAALLAGYAGLRCFEITRADRDHIFYLPEPDVSPLDSMWIRIQGKGGRIDTVPLPRTPWTHLRGRRAGPLVRDTHGQRYRPNTLSKLFAVHMRRDLGLNGIGLHLLRHLYIDELRRDGVDMETVRALARHASLNTTQRYFCVKDVERRLAVRTLHAHANPLKRAA